MRRPPLVEFSALSIMPVDAENNEELRSVKFSHTSSLGLYVYVHGDNTPVDPPYVVEAARSTGRWFFLGNKRSLFANLQSVRACSCWLCMWLKSLDGTPLRECPIRKAPPDLLSFA